MKIEHEFTDFWAFFGSSDTWVSDEMSGEDIAKETKYLEKCYKCR